MEEAVKLKLKKKLRIFFLSCLVFLFILSSVSKVWAYTYNIEDFDSDIGNLGTVSLKDEHPSDTASASASGQAFNTSYRFILGYVRFYLQRAANPTANLTAAIYQCTGTMGTDSKPTGNALVWSSPVNSSTISAVANQWVSFNFSSSLFLLNASSEYCVALTVNTSNVDAVNFVRSRIDLNKGHYGNNFNYKNNAWAAGANDALFRLYSIVDNVNPVISYMGFNSTLNNQGTRFQFNVSDNFYLSHLVFGWNNSGVWINNSQSLSGSSQIVYYTDTVNETVGYIIEFQVWVNDSVNNWLTIPLHFFEVNDPAKAVDFLGYLILAPLSIGFVVCLIYWAARKK